MWLAVASMSRKFFKVFHSLFVWYLYGLRRVAISLSGALSQLKRETHHVYIRIHAIKPFFPRFRWAACLDFFIDWSIIFPHLALAVAVAPWGQRHSTCCFVQLIVTLRRVSKIPDSLKTFSSFWLGRLFLFFCIGFKNFGRLAISGTLDSSIWANQR